MCIREDIGRPLDYFLEFLGQGKFVVHDIVANMLRWAIHETILCTRLRHLIMYTQDVCKSYTHSEHAYK